MSCSSTSLQNRKTSFIKFCSEHKFLVTYSFAGKRIHLQNNRYDVEFLHDNYKEIEI